VHLLIISPATSLGGDKLFYKILDPKLEKLRESSYSYLKLFIISAIIFIGTIIIGVILNQYIAEFAYEYMLAPILNIIYKIYDYAFLVVLFVFFKNSLAIITCIFLARRTKGISLAFLLGLNGIIIGAILIMFYMSGMSLLLIITGIMPHGIFEFTGVFLGASYGFKLLFVKEEDINEYNIEVKNRVIKTLIPLLFIAAFIEVYITPVFMIMVL
jgi:stage II sporulation protein M